MTRNREAGSCKLFLEFVEDVKDEGKEVGRI